MDLKYSELTLNNIGEWPLLIKVLFIAVTCFVIIAAGYWFGVCSQQNRARAVSQQEKIMVQKIQTMYITVVNHKEATTTVKQLEDLYSPMLATLPTRPDLPLLLDKINRISRANHLMLQSMQPGTEQRQELFNIVPIKMIAYGSYNNLANFVSQFANDERFASIDRMSLTRIQGKDTRNQVTTTLKMEFTINAYLRQRNEGSS